MSLEMSYDEFEDAYFLKWPVNLDLDGIINLLVNPSAAEKNARQIRVENSITKPLLSYLAKRGYVVKLKSKNYEYLKRKDAWCLKLEDGCAEYTEDELLKFLTNMGNDMRPVQEQGILLAFKNYLTLMSAICGSGKTLIILSIVQFLKNKKGCKAVILAPGPVTGEFLKELKKFSGSFNLTINNLADCSTFEARCRIEENNCDILIVPYSKVHKFKSEIREMAIKSEDSETILICDEGHFLKNVGTRVGKAVKSFAPFYNRVLVSTATPMPFGPCDIRGYLSLVSDPLPKKYYKNSIPTKDLAILQGITFVSGEEDLVYADVEKTKIEYKMQSDLDSALYEHVQNEIDGGGKAVVFCSTNRAMERIFSIFPKIDKRVLSGSFHTSREENGKLLEGRDKKKQDEAVDDFNTDSNCKLLIINYRVGSTGLNLQQSGASLAFYYEITNNGADFFQSKYRIRRPFIFPEGGFKFVYAIPASMKDRKRVNKQFTKLHEQQELLAELKKSSTGL